MNNKIPWLSKSTYLVLIFLYVIIILVAQSNASTAYSNSACAKPTAKLSGDSYTGCLEVSQSCYTYTDFRDVAGGQQLSPSIPLSEQAMPVTANVLASNARSAKWLLTCPINPQDSNAASSSLTYFSATPSTFIGGDACLSQQQQMYLTMEYATNINICWNLQTPAYLDYLQNVFTPPGFATDNFQGNNKGALTVTNAAPAKITSYSNTNKISLLFVGEIGSILSFLMPSNLISATVGTYGGEIDNLGYTGQNTHMPVAIFSTVSFNVSNGYNSKSYVFQQLPTNISAVWSWDAQLINFSDTVPLSLDISIPDLKYELSCTNYGECSNSMGGTNGPCIMTVKDQEWSYTSESSFSMQLNNSNIPIPVPERISPSGLSFDGMNYSSSSSSPVSGSCASCLYYAPYGCKHVCGEQYYHIGSGTAYENGKAYYAKVWLNNDKSKLIAAFNNGGSINSLSVSSNVANLGPSPVLPYFYYNITIPVGYTTLTGQTTYLNESFNLYSPPNFLPPANNLDPFKLNTSSAFFASLNNTLVEFPYNVTYYTFNAMSYDNSFNQSSGDFFVIDSGKPNTFVNISNPLSIISTPENNVYILNSTSTCTGGFWGVCWSSSKISNLIKGTLVPKGYMELPNVLQPRNFFNGKSNFSGAAEWNIAWENYWMNVTDMLAQNFYITEATTVSKGSGYIFGWDTHYNCDNSNKGSSCLQGFNPFAMSSDYSNDVFMLGKNNGKTEIVGFLSNGSVIINDSVNIPKVFQVEKGSEIAATPGGQYVYVSNPDSSNIPIYNTKEDFAFVGNISLVFNNLNISSYIKNSESDSLYQTSIKNAYNNAPEVLDSPANHHPVAIADYDGMLYVVDDWTFQINGNPSAILLLRVFLANNTELPINGTVFNDLGVPTVSCSYGGVPRCFSGSTGVSSVACVNIHNVNIPKSTPTCGSGSYTPACSSDGTPYCKPSYTSLMNPSSNSTEIYPPYGWILSENISTGNSYATLDITQILPMLLQVDTPYPPIGPSIPATYKPGVTGPDVGDFGFSIGYDGTAAILAHVKGGWASSSPYTELVFFNANLYNYTRLSKMAYSPFKCYVNNSLNGVINYNYGSSSNAGYSLCGQTPVLTYTYAPIAVAPNAFQYATSRGTPNDYFSVSSSLASLCPPGSPCSVSQSGASGSGYSGVECISHNKLTSYATCPIDQEGLSCTNGGQPSCTSTGSVSCGVSGSTALCTSSTLGVYEPICVSGKPSCNIPKCENGNTGSSYSCTISGTPSCSSGSMECPIVAQPSSPQSNNYKITPVFINSTLSGYIDRPFNYSYAFSIKDDYDQKIIDSGKSTPSSCSSGYTCDASKICNWGFTQSVSSNNYTYYVDNYYKASSINESVRGGFIYLENVAKQNFYNASTSDADLIVSPSLYYYMFTSRGFGEIFVNQTANPANNLNTPLVLNASKNVAYYQIVYINQSGGNEPSTENPGFAYEYVAAPFQNIYGIDPFAPSNLESVLLTGVNKNPYYYNSIDAFAGNVLISYNITPNNNFSTSLSLLSIYGASVRKNMLGIFSTSNSLLGFNRLVYTFVDNFNNTFYAPVYVDFARQTYIDLNASTTVDSSNSNESTIEISGTLYSCSGPLYTDCSPYSESVPIYIYYNGNLNYYDPADYASKPTGYDYSNFTKNYFEYVENCAFNPSIASHSNCTLANPLSTNTISYSMGSASESFNSSGIAAANLTTYYFGAPNGGCPGPANSMLSAFQNVNCNVNNPGYSTLPLPSCTIGNEIALNEINNGNYIVAFCIPIYPNGSGVYSTEVGLANVIMTNGGSFNAQIKVCGTGEGRITAEFYGYPSPEPQIFSLNQLNESIYVTNTLSSEQNINLLPEYNYTIMPTKQMVITNIGGYVLSYNNLYGPLGIGILLLLVGIAMYMNARKAKTLLRHKLKHK
ncbi:MAG: hypothetical protein ACP5RP_03915 [Candidatus Micrarchaeia archaeon]